MSKLRAEELSFLERAPKRWDFEEPVAAPPDVVFAAISADPSTWSWFPGLSRDARYHGPGPHGVGSIREVSMAGTTYKETILAWDPPSRWAYRVDECSAPIARALVEDWAIEPKGDGSVVRWTFTIDPRALFVAGLPVAGPLMGKLFAKAMRNLSEQLVAAGPALAMRFSFAESMTDPSFYAPLARAAEGAGYDSFVVPDSLAYPKESDDTYPYNPDGTREFLEDKPFLEPFSLIPALGAVTERLRFTTFVLKLPIRHPLLVAKQATSTAVLTNGRLVLGVGTSPWTTDYKLLGVPWEGRGRRMDEAIEILRGLSTGDWFEFHGEFYDIPAAKMAPAAAVPILIGGHGEPALKRAARVGDGWMHGGGDLSQLPVLLRRLAELREEAGRSELPFEVHVISLDAYTVDGVKRLEDTGVTDVIVGFRWPYHTGPDPQSLQEKLDSLRRFAEDVIQNVKA